MSNFEIYISCPISLADAVLTKYVRAAKKLDAEVHYWNRGSTYSETNNINVCNAFVLILPQEKWKERVNSLPNGCRLELSLAQKASKKIFIGYTTADGEVKFYEASLCDGYISGWAGSSKILPKLIGSSERPLIYYDRDFVLNPCAELILEKSSNVIIPVTRI